MMRCPITYYSTFEGHIREFATLIWGLWSAPGVPVSFPSSSLREPGTITSCIVPYPTQPGQVGGHEGVGIIQKLGPGNEKAQVKLGDRVGIKVSLPVESSKEVRMLRAI